MGVSGGCVEWVVITGSWLMWGGNMVGDRVVIVGVVERD